MSGGGGGKPGAQGFFASDFPRRPRRTGRNIGNAVPDRIELGGLYDYAIVDEIVFECTCYRTRDGHTHRGKFKKTQEGLFVWVPTPFGSYGEGRWKKVE